MPSKNSQKLYLENGYYHIYNRGAGKGEIFLVDQDYKVFIHFLEKYLDPKSERTLASEVKLLAYCLMPNHFHLFVHQTSKDGIVKLMRSLCTSYSMYLNKKYNKVGNTFQDTFKSVLIEGNEQLMWIFEYIHSNPVKDRLVKTAGEYPWSSYNDFTNNRNLLIVDKEYRDLVTG